MKVAERLLALVREIEVRPGQSAVKLADKFGCSPRTIERDIQERFPELGVVAVNQGGYRFLQKPHLRALALSHEELVSIILAHKVAEPSLDDSTAIALNRVLDKIRSGLSSWDKSTAERLGARTAANPSPETQADTSATLFAGLTEAITSQLRVTFRYRGRDDQAEENRYVEPLGLFFQDKRWYLQAFDVNRQGVRTFRLARIGALQTTEERFEPEESFSSESAQFHQYDIADGEPVTLRLLLPAALARWFEENKPHPTVRVDGNDATLTVSNPEAFLRWFSSLDGAQVVEPERYRSWFIQRLQQLQKLY